MRFRLRTLFVLVTLCALAAMGWRQYTRVYRPLQVHRQQVQQCAEVQAMWNRVSFNIPDWARHDLQIRETFHQQKVGEYERALLRPWLKVESGDWPRDLGPRAVPRAVMP
jgi:hypothetical protein